MTPATPPMPMGDIGANAPPPGIGSLMGPPSEQSQPSPLNQDRVVNELNNTQKQIQGLSATAAQIAMQYPAFAEAADAIKKACDQGRVKLVASQLRGLEGPPPPTAGV